MFALKTAAGKAVMPAVRVASRRSASNVASRSGKHLSTYKLHAKPPSIKPHSQLVSPVVLVSTRQALSAGNNMV
jgi:hypothetical protein